MITGRYGSASSGGRYHNSHPFSAICSLPGPSQVPWTNQPAALTEFRTNVEAVFFRAPLDAKDAEQLYQRANCEVAGAAAAEVRVQYSIDSGASWLNAFTFMPLDAGVVTAETVVIPSAAKIQSLQLRLVGQNGNGAADPNGDFGLCLTGAARGLTGGDWPGDRQPHWKSQRSAKRLYIKGYQTFTFSGTWTNMPAALTVVPNPPMPTNPIITIANFSQWHAGFVRLWTNVNPAGAAGAVLRLQYSINGGASFAFIDSETTNTGGAVAIDGATGLKVGAYVKVDKALLRSNVALPQYRMMGQGGNGVTDPLFKNAGWEFADYDPSQY